jgi:flagellar biosynthesis GTPase FlhF
MKYIIYKIQINDYIYIGSTKNFAIRKSRHKSNCNTGKDYLVYRTIRENGGWECCTMVPVREVEVETVIQAHIIEEEERVKYNAQMNAIRAYMTEDEKKAVNYERLVRWREENKEMADETRKIWREANKEKRNEYQRKWRAAKRAEQTSQPNI